MVESRKGMLSVRVQWPTTPSVPVPATQFAAMVLPPEEDVPGSMLLSFGYVSVPVLSGSPAEQEEQARQITSLDVLQVGKFLLTKRASRELLGILSESVARWDEIDTEGDQKDGDAS